MYSNKEILIGTFKIVLKNRDNIQPAINALQNNIIITDLPKITATRIYSSDSNIYIELVSNEFRYMSSDKILIIKKNIQNIIKFEINNFSFMERKYSTYVEEIRKEESKRPGVVEMIWKYIFS